MTDNEKFDLILTKLEKLDKIDKLETDVTQLKNDVTQLKNDATQLKNDVTEIKLTLENEIRVNIQRIAEGHLDLSRKLHEALKIDDEKEMLSIRMNIMETELRRLKERGEQIA